MDELETHERREGMYGSIFWWVVKLGMAAALAAGGFLLNATGFDVALEGNQTERHNIADADIRCICAGHHLRHRHMGDRELLDYRRTRT